MRHPATQFVLLAMLLDACSPSAPKPAATVPLGPVKITQFYASPPNPAPGEHASVCYGTENATVVRLDPPDREMWPSPARCFDVVLGNPKITYTLTAERGAERVSQSITLAAGAPRIEILSVTVDAKEVSRGTMMHVCYKARNAASVTVTPGVYIQQEPDRGCVQQVMDETTTFKVRAKDAAGDIADGEDVEVKVTGGQRPGTRGQ